MPLFDPTFYTNEKQEDKSIVYKPTKPELIGSSFWRYIIIAAAIVIIFIVAIGVMQ